MNDNTNTTPQEQPDVGNKTFSQEDVNRIVQERLNRERAKPDATLAQREQELAKREFQLHAREAVSKAGLPAGWIDILDKTDKESFDKALAFVAKELGAKNEPLKAGGSGFFGKTPPGNQDADVRQAMGLK